VTKPYPEAYRALAGRCAEAAAHERLEAYALIVEHDEYDARVRQWVKVKSRGFAFYCGGRGQPAVRCTTMMEWDAAVAAAVRFERAGGAN
jgi:hypothetical protein